MRADSAGGQAVSLESGWVRSASSHHRLCADPSGSRSKDACDGVQDPPDGPG